MERMSNLMAMVVVVALAGSANAVVNLGTGSGSLLGNDLTDLNNVSDGSTYNPPGNLGGFDAVFFGDDEAFFTPPGNTEGAFNVFDNIKGGGQGKWCCSSADAGDGVHVGADFSTTLLSNGGRIVLTRFTLTSDNDVGTSRDPDQWAIQGSNDGSTWATIYSYDIAGNSIFDDFGGSPNNRTLQFDAGVDFATPAGYTSFRYLATSSVNDGNHAISELELFGTIVPEPATATLGLLSLAGLMMRRRRAA